MSKNKVFKRSKIIDWGKKKFKIQRLLLSLVQKSDSGALPFFDLTLGSWNEMEAVIRTSKSRTEHSGSRGCFLEVSVPDMDHISSCLHVRRL